MNELKASYQAEGWGKPQPINYCTKIKQVNDSPRSWHSRHVTKLSLFGNNRSRGRSKTNRRRIRTKKSSSSCFVLSTLFFIHYFKIINITDLEKRIWSLTLGVIKLIIITAEIVWCPEVAVNPGLKSNREDERQGSRSLWCLRIKDKVSCVCVFLFFRVL